MRSFVAWAGTFSIFLTLLVVLFTFPGIITNNLQIELIGSFLGVAVGFSLTQLAINYAAYRNIMNMIPKLYRELKFVESSLARYAVGYVFSTPVWETAKGRGLLEIMDDYTADILCRAYEAVDYLNQDIILREKLLLLDNQERATQIRNSIRELHKEGLKSLQKACNWLVETFEILEK